MITASYVRDLLPDLACESPPRDFEPALDRWWQRVDDTLGPASSVRSIADCAVIPLLRLLDLSVASRAEVDGGCLLQTRWSNQHGPQVLVVSWNQPLAPAWRAAILAAIAVDCRWAFCVNGTALRIVDARRTWSRDYLEFDLAVTAHHTEPRSLLWTLARGEAVTGAAALLDRAADQSARHGVDVCRALGTGVLEALTALVGCLHAGSRSRSSSPQVSLRVDGGRTVLDVSITVLYRVLFLLFAEARGLVPMWHAVYRNRYSLEAIVATLLAGRPCRGLWQAVQAISRLASSGCRAGELKVNAFNGRLFSPAEIGILNRRVIPDAVMATAIAAVATRPVRRPRLPASGGSTPMTGRQPISYRELDVEQLGAIYEQVLEYEPRLEETAVLARTREMRKASATFYTPRWVSAFLVQQTLSPLVEGKSAAEILRLRVLDPAMGSGAFLVAACRYLAAAAEDALIREGRWHPGDVTPVDRISLRREVALGCLFGVDLNPMAVQLARLSLWLATLAADKPLSFLDHHLVTGDSLVGAAPDDVQRRPSRIAGRRQREEALPLFDHESLGLALQHAVRIRLALSAEADDSPAIVREKERTLAGLRTDPSPLNRWSRLLDLWCAGWFWQPGTPPDRAAFAELSGAILRDRTSLPPSIATDMLARSDAIARERRFLHWPLAFPEVFTSPSGDRPADSGFDAVLGNPPWDMIRGDSGSEDDRRSRRQLASQLTAFARESGIYRVDTRAHLNRYQLFVERALQLTRSGGRIGLVLPSGIASDAGAAALRRHLFDHADIESITGLDNRAGIFPIHRSVRFALVTGTRGRPTAAITCRFGLSGNEELAQPGDGRGAPLILTRRLLDRLSGEEDLGIPELHTETDLRIVERLTADIPRLGSERGWNAKFGRELNASDDRASLRRASRAPGSRPVVEGKQIDSFRVALEHCRYELRPDAAAATRAASVARIGYRDVASATNRLTLIAAIIPAHAVTTHTVFCLKTRLAESEQHVLCALLNSFVANYLIRLRVNTHVTATLMARLPVPFLRATDPRFAQLSSLARALARAGLRVDEMPEYTELQAVIAQLYRVSAAEFEHVLSTFPLVNEALRMEALGKFGRLVG
ncbi:MAG TPA: N-6 DNA methylase [Vicinamibacterales bacterium]|nr:N-6 DNA methylase [Vicinamibacterales bacterium]